MTPAWPWACAGAGLLSALLFAHDVLAGPNGAWAPALDWRPERAWQAPWRAWTAALVHHGPQHLAANLAGCAVVGWFGYAAGLGGRALLATAAAWPLTQALLLCTPELSRYGGMSGVLHAAVAVAVVSLVTTGPGRPRWVGLAVGSGLLAKVLLEAPWRGAVQELPGWDVPVAVAAHATGLVSGTLMMAAMAALEVAHRTRLKRTRTR